MAAFAPRRPAGPFLGGFQTPALRARANSYDRAASETLHRSGPSQHREVARVGSRCSLTLSDVAKLQISFRLSCGVNGVSARFLQPTCRSAIAGSALYPAGVPATGASTPHSRMKSGPGKLGSAKQLTAMPRLSGCDRLPRRRCCRSLGKNESGSRTRCRLYARRFCARLRSRTSLFSQRLPLWTLLRVQDNHGPRPARKYWPS